MSLFQLYLIFITLVSCSRAETSCVDMKKSNKMKNFYNTRRNFVSSTSVSCTINFFDIDIVNRLTLNVIAKSETLRHLDLSFNGINEIYNETFSEFVSLESLKLRDNFLTAIREYHFSELSELAVLDLSSNLLQFIDIKAFTALPNLLSLNIKDNCLINIHLNFRTHSLHSLDLSENRINNFPQLGGSINAITNLDLSYNIIRTTLTTNTEIMRNVVKSISSLNVAGNQLKHPNQLLSFVNLIELNLSGNIIEYDENENFVRNCAALRKLNLTNTNLTSLSIFRHLNGENFEELSLAHNPLLTDFNELAKFSNAKILEFHQKSCQVHNSYRTIKRNFKHLQCVAIFYDDTPNCACLRQNEMLLMHESIDFITDWNMCSPSSSTTVNVLRYNGQFWELLLLIATFNVIKKFSPSSLLPLG